MEGLPAAKAERIAAMRRELADLQRQLTDAQQRVTAELQGRAEDAERIEVLEAHLQAHEQKAVEAEGLRAKLASLSATVEELRREVATRDSQIADAQRQHRETSEHLAAHATSAQEAKTLAETRDAELATRTGERDAEQAKRSQIERELEEHRAQQQKTLAEQLELQAAIAKERDAFKTELEQARQELEAGRTKAREIGGQLAKLGQDFGDTVMPPPRPSRPPPMPPVPTRPSSPEVATVIEVTDDARPARTGMTVLMVLGGVLVGGGLTFAVVKATSSTPQAAASQADIGAAPAPAAAPGTAPENPPLAAPIEGVAEQPSTGANNPTPPVDNAAPIAEPAKEGVLLLPDDASGHRLFVDGKVIDFKGTRVTVPCGSHVVQVGSRGTARNLDIKCGGETTVPAEPER